MSGLAEAYRGRRVLVTGHTGFKGSWLAAWLHRMGAQVHGFALPPPTTPSHFVEADLASLVTHHEGDVRDPGALAAAFDAARPEVVFHLAAQPLVRVSYDEPRLTFETNLMGTVNVLEEARKRDGVRAAVMITSDKCYENVEWPYAYRENDTLGGHDPYSASKAAAEMAISAYARSFARRRGAPLGVASTRAGNVIGGGDWAKDRIVPDCVRALTAKRPVEVRNPVAVRPWQHVLEPLSGYLALGARLLRDPTSLNEAFNFGPLSPRPLTVEELVRAFVAAWGAGEVHVAPIDGAPHEATLLRLSCEKAAARLGWTPKLDAAETVRWTASWYRRWFDDRAHARAVTFEQIEAYAARLAPEPA